LTGSAAFHIFRVLLGLRKLFMPSYERGQFIGGLKILNSGLGVFLKERVGCSPFLGIISLVAVDISSSGYPFRRPTTSCDTIDAIAKK